MCISCAWRHVARLRALRVFADALPKRRSAWFARKLKHIRRAAGKARDLDVLAERLTQQHPSGYEAVLDEIGRHRAAAQEPIVYIHERIADKRFVERAGELVERVRWRGRGPAPKTAKAARKVLRPIVEQFLRQGNADLRELTALHRLRIDGKRLRYAIELLAAALEPSLRRDIYPEIKQIQLQLGRINDRHVALAYYQRWASVASDTPLAGALADLAAGEKADMLAGADAFRHGFSPDYVDGLVAAFQSLRLARD